MCLLYDYSAKVNALVVGTSNKSERLLGYGTIYGDTACALNPIGELFKTEIYELARELGIDEKIIAKAPSADLWEGQSDEADIGYSYERLDEILRLAQSKSEDELARKFDPQIRRPGCFYPLKLPSNFIQKRQISPFLTAKTSAKFTAET